jgi:hypothetical protein
MATATLTRPTMVTRSIEPDRVEVDKPRRQIRAIINDESVDRYGTVLDPAGIDTTAYMEAGGPVLYEHGKSPRGTLPVGNTIEIGASRYKGQAVTIATVKFWEGDASDPLPETLWRRYASREMRTWSVHLLPLAQSAPTHEERRARPELERCTIIYRAGELLELSATPIPGNKSCLTLEVLRSSATTSPYDRFSPQEQSRVAREFDLELQARNRWIVDQFTAEFRAGFERLTKNQEAAEQAAEQSRAVRALEDRLAARDQEVVATVLGGLRRYLESGAWSTSITAGGR